MISMLIFFHLSNTKGWVRLVAVAWYASQCPILLTEDFKYTDAKNTVYK